MFEVRRRQSNLAIILSLAELTYHSTVRKVRQGHGNAFMALIMNMLQAAMFVAAFFFMFNILGSRGAAIRGNFVIYLLSGIFLYLTHIKALSATMGAEGPASAMMQHAPMNTIVAILSSALQVLYLQTMAILIILFLVHTLWEPVEIYRWAPAFGMYLLAWLSGVAVGLVLLALKPWIPDVVGIIQTVWTRANMIASGKMFVANMMTPKMVAMFSWNPLFHAIDQCRGYSFSNYVPHNSNWQYPLYFCICLIFLGLMGEFYSRKHVSASWGAKR